MASTKTRTKTIRIANDAADYYEEVALNRVAEGVYHLLKEGKLEFDGEEVKIVASGGVHTEDTVIFPHSVTIMLGLCGISMENMAKTIEEMLIDGRLTLVNKEIVVGQPYWVSRLEDACHDKCLDVEKVVENAVKAIQRGTL